jgi:predicted transcriptional regulator
MARSQLKLILVQEDISVKELAAASDVNYNTLSGIVNGNRPYYDHAYDIVDGLNSLVRKRYKFDQVFPNYSTMKIRAK